MQDVKEVVGVIMRVLDHAEIDEAEVLDLDFEAEGEALAALNDAYIKLLEFVHDRDMRRARARGSTGLTEQDRPGLRCRSPLPLNGGGPPLPIFEAAAPRRCIHPLAIGPADGASALVHPLVPQSLFVGDRLAPLRAGARLR